MIRLFDNALDWYRTTVRRLDLRHIRVIDLGGGRGLNMYGSPVATTYGHLIEVQDSSSAEGPHCWMWVYPGEYGTRDDSVTGARGVHLSLDEAVEIRDRLDRFILEAPKRWL